MAGRTACLALLAGIALAADPVAINDVTASPDLQGAFHVTIVGTNAFVAAESGNSLTIVDISTPSSLSVTGTVQDNTNLNQPRGVVVSGSVAYVACYGGHSLTTVDVSTPASPSVLGQVIDATNLNGAIHVQLVGTNAFVSCHLGHALAVVDVSTPATPDYASVGSSLVDATNLQGAAGFVISGNYAYIAVLNGNGFAVVDVSNAASLSLTGNLIGNTDLTQAANVVVSGTLAYVACMGGKLTIVDVSTPASPSVTGSLSDATNLNGAWGIALSGSYAYVATYTSKSVAIVDVSTPASPTLTDSKIDTTKLDGSRALALDASNNIYVASGAYNGLTAWSWTSPASAGSDPVARYGNMVRVFELPLGELVPLVVTPDITIQGSVFPGGPWEQWFNRMVLSTPDERFMDIRMADLSLGFNRSASQRNHLQTLQITVGEGSISNPRRLKRISSSSAIIDAESMGGYQGVTRRVLRSSSSQNPMIGSYNRECVELAGHWLHFYVCSAPADEYYGDFRHLAVEYAHLDLLLIEIRDHGKLSGVLPELWGIVPMSETTKSYLIEDKTANISQHSSSIDLAVESQTCSEGCISE